MQTQQNTLIQDIPFLSIDPTNGFVKKTGETLTLKIKAPLKKATKKIEIRTIQSKKPVKVVTAPISGSYFIKDTASLLDYCLKWCKTVYPNKIIFRSVQNTGTLMMIIPDKNIFFIQFLYGKEAQNTYQKDFQYHINPTPVHIFKTFPVFQEFVQAQYK